jgi:RND superfamily putative drug exporter
MVPVTVSVNGKNRPLVGLRNLATISVRSRRAAIVTVVLWVLLAAAAPGLAPQLASVENNRTINDPPATAQSVQARALLAKAFPNERGTPAILVLRDPRGLGAGGEREIRRITQALRGPGHPPDIGAVVSPLSSPAARRALLSRDGTTAQIIVPVLGASSEDGFGKTVDAIRRVAGTGHDGLEIRLTGPAGIARDTVKAFGSANLVLLFGTVSLVLLLLLAIYRAPALALMPLVAVSIAFELTNALGASLVKAGAFSVSSQAASIMTVLLFGIGTDYCLFIVARHREELRRTSDRFAAMRSAMGSLGAPLLSSAATVVLALLGLLLATLPALRGFGPFLALSVVVMLAVALTFVPAVVCLLGRATEWPRRATRRRSEARLWSAVAALVVRRPLATMASALVALAILSAGLVDYRESYDFISGFRVATDSGRGRELLQQGFPPGSLAPTNVLVEDRAGRIDQRGGALTDLRRSLGDVPGVLAVSPPKLSPDNRVAALQVTYRGNPYGGAALDRTARLREIVPATLSTTELRGSRSLVGGESAVSLDLRTANDHDLLVVAPVTIAIIALVLALLLRSLVAPLYLVATILASFAATLGLTVFCLLTLGGDEGMGVRVTIYIFVFLVALGVDYNILLTSRIREETRLHGRVEGIRLAVARTGGVISSAGVILAGTFAVLMTQPIRELYQFGFAMAAGLLLDTFVIRGMLVPAIARLLGDRNWWPGRIHAPASAPPEPRSHESPIPAATNG